MLLGDTRGSKEDPASCSRGFMQVNVTFTIQRWPEGATGLEVLILETERNTLPPDQPVPAMPLPTVLARFDMSREDVQQFFRGMAKAAGVSLRKLGTGMPFELTSSAVLRCDGPSRGALCSLHGDAGSVTNEKDNIFELDAEIRIYGERNGQRVILSQRMAHTRIDVHCAAGQR